MSLFSDQQKKQVNVAVYKFPVPQTRNVRFEQIIRGDANSPVFNQMAALTKARDEAVLSLCNSRSSFDAIRGALERWAPLAFGFTEAIESNPTIRLAQPLSFAWSSPTRDTASSRHWSTFFTTEFEVVMTLVAQGVALVNLAEATSRSITDKNFAELAPKAVQSLRAAAGIFEFVASSELPRWSNVPEERPPEAYTTVIGALATYALAAAQEFMVLKGSLADTSKGVLAKLQADVHRKYEEAATTLCAKPQNKTAAPGAAICEFVKSMALLSKARMFMFAAQASQEEQKSGEAVAYADMAAETLRAVQPAKSQLEQWRGTMELIRAEIEHVQRSCKMENDMVTFGKVADPRMLQQPEPKSLVTPIPYTPSHVSVIVS